MVHMEEKMGKERCRNRLRNKKPVLCRVFLLPEVMNREAAKMGLQVLFHEKPFAGINGSGSSVSMESRCGCV